MAIPSCHFFRYWSLEFRHKLGVSLTESIPKTILANARSAYLNWRKNTMKTQSSLSIVEVPLMLLWEVRRVFIIYFMCMSAYYWWRNVSLDSLLPIFLKDLLMHGAEWTISRCVLFPPSCLFPLQTVTTNQRHFIRNWPSCFSLLPRLSNRMPLISCIKSSHVFFAVR